jgi:flagellar basal-body rod protein FlgC
MPSTIAIALSGLQAASLRLDASAHDVANALTEGYTPLRVEQREVPAGGVEASVSRAADPGELRADAALAGTLPARVDLVGEIAGQLSARRAYQASLAVLRAADEAERSLLEVVG